MLLLKIVGGVLALAFGIWMGLPGRAPTAGEIEKAMDQPGRQRHSVMRHFTPLDWLTRARRGHARPSRRRFSLMKPSEHPRGDRGQ